MYDHDLKYSITVLGVIDLMISDYFFELFLTFANP